MIYHLLDEPFSARTGLGITTVVANIIRFDNESVVVCPEADQTRRLRKDRLLVLPYLSFFVRLKGLRFVPTVIRNNFIRTLFSGLLERLKEGDIVWCHNWPYVAAALAPIVHLKGARLVYHSHNSLSAYRKRVVFHSFTPDAFVFNSNAMLREALNLFPHFTNTYTIHNGADEAVFFPNHVGGKTASTVPTILYVGRLHPDKGAHVLIAAMKILAERDVAAICKLVGSSHAGGSKSKATSYVDSLFKNSPSNVKFVGFRLGTTIADAYRDADIVCCPSIWQEPFGNVNVEAMACGLPVVASRVGGIVEIASEGGVVLVAPDAPIELADALQRLVLDQELRASVGAQGLASFRRRFTWSKIADQHLEIAHRLAQGNKSGTTPSLPV